jgi:hypothetical protein
MNTFLYLIGGLVLLAGAATWGACWLARERDGNLTQRREVAKTQGLEDWGQW